MRVEGDSDHRPLTAPSLLLRNEDTVSYVNLTTEDMAPKRINIIFQVIQTILSSVLIRGMHTLCPAVI